MRKQRNKNVELPRFKRSTSNWEGKVIEYLLAYPGKTAVELTGEALTSYWLVEALEGKVSDEEFQKACRAAAENLSKKLASIQQMSNLNTITSVPSFTPPVSPTTQPVVTQALQNDEDENEEDDDDWDMNLQPTADMIAANQIFKKE
ncbi:hypothetical protein IQ243_25975 [Nostocales cyanobacterium LEGE 11386]|nr:hypothetical protein [Nostocales cyanobacterium LEGE 11386]